LIETIERLEVLNDLETFADHAVAKRQTSVGAIYTLL
jgi:hypothetical protein